MTMRRLKVSLSLFFLILLVERCIGTKISKSIEDAEYGDSQDKIQSQIKRVLTPITQMHFPFNQKISMATSKIPVKIRENILINDKINKLETVLTDIDLLFDTNLMKIWENSTDPATKNELINRVLYSSSNIFLTTRRIHSIVLDEKIGESNFLTELNNQLQIHANDICDDTLSPQQHLYDIYLNIISAETKAFALNSASYLINAIISKISHQNLIDSETKSFLNRTNNYKEAILQELGRASRAIHRCDPSKHERGNTFIEFEKVQQPYIFNEDQYQPREQCSSCRKNVSEFGNQLTFQTGDTVEPVQEVQYPVSRPCNGIVHSCDKFGYFFQYGGEVCLLPEDSVKRYGWIKSYGSSVTYGDQSQCNGAVVKSLYKHTWKEQKGATRFYYSPNLYYCHYCLCICEDQHPLKSLRAINIRGLVTNTIENMVVTGIRLVEQKRMIHVQMKRGKLLPGGRVDPDSESWMLLEDMDYVKNEIKYNESYTEFMSINHDYVVINDYDFNLVLEDIMADKNMAICGVKFQAVHQHQFKGIKLQIATASFNWTAGTIDSKCQWQPELSSNLVKKASDDLGIIKKMENLDDPLKSKNNVPDLKNTIIKFSMSDMQKDAGQSMVPFLDALPVETKPAAPLSGVGLFHKGTRGFGGFVSPRIYNVDLTDYVRLF